MQQGFVLWFTGFSGAGKSTIANKVVEQLRDRGVAVRSSLATGMLHGHLNRTPALPEVSRSLDVLAGALRDRTAPRARAGREPSRRRRRPSAGGPSGSGHNGQIGH